MDVGTVRTNYIGGANGGQSTLKMPVFLSDPVSVHREGYADYRQDK
jgi:hypothetical protein